MVCTGTIFFRIITFWYNCQVKRCKIPPKYYQTYKTDFLILINTPPCGRGYSFMNNIKMAFCIQLLEHVLDDLITMKCSAYSIHQFEQGNAIKLWLEKTSDGSIIKQSTYKKLFLLRITIENKIFIVTEHALIPTIFFKTLEFAGFKTRFLQQDGRKSHLPAMLDGIIFSLWSSLAMNYK